MPRYRPPIKEKELFRLYGDEMVVTNCYGPSYPCTLEELYVAFKQRLLRELHETTIPEEE